MKNSNYFRRKQSENKRKRKPSFLDSCAFNLFNNEMKECMLSKKEVLKRYILFVISLFFAAFGVAITKRGELGVSPISSVVNVMSSFSDSVSLGTWLVIWNCILILGQIVLLRKNFMPVQLLQIPLSFLFGIFTDFGMYCVSFIAVPNYAVRIILVLVGTLTLGFGISLSVVANVIMNSGEAFVKAVSDRTGIRFGNVKIGFDICCVLASVILSLILFSGTVVGTREGTVLTALLTGIVVNFFVKRIEKPLNSALND